MRQSGLDFGYTPYLSTSRAQTLTMTNHTRGKVLVVWQLPTTHGAGGPDAGHSVATQVHPPATSPYLPFVPPASPWPLPLCSVPSHARRSLCHPLSNRPS